MKIVNLPTSANDFKKLADEAMVKQDFVQAMRYISSALKVPNLKRKEKTDLKLQFARLLAIRGKYGYSTDALFEVLSQEPKNGEAFSLLLYNYQALGVDSLVSYYGDKAHGYLEKRKKDLKKIISEAPGMVMDLDGQEIDVDSLTDEDIDDMLGTGSVGKDQKKNNIFTVIGNDDKFENEIAKMYDAASRQDFANATEHANNAIKLNVAESKKVVPYYTKAVALMFMNYLKEALDLTTFIVEKYPKDMMIRILRCEIQSMMKDLDGVKASLKFFEEKQVDETLPFDRILDIYLKNGLYKEGIEFIKPRLNAFIDSYTLHTYLGIFYFNLGEVDKAKSMLSALNGLYGDLCNARHLLNYINYGIQAPITTSPLTDNLLELTNKYMNEFCFYLEQKGISAISYITMDVDNFIQKLKWMSLHQGVEITKAVIQKIYMEDEHIMNKDMLVKWKILKKELPKLLVSIDNISPYIKEEIVHYELFVKNKVAIVNDGKFYIAEPMLDIYSLPISIMRPLIQAFAYCISRCEELYIKVFRFAHELNRRNSEKKLEWRSDIVTFAIIMYYVYDCEPLEKNMPYFKYNKKLFEKYLEEFNENF